MSFNKYKWVQMVEDEIFTKAEDDIIRSQDDAWELVNTMIDDSTIYNSDCFDIIKELNYFDWENSDLPVTNIRQAAYNALLDLAIEKVDIEKNLYNVQ
jgi:phospholipid N-methyltransferase